MTRKVVRTRLDIPAHLCAGELEALGFVLQRLVGNAAAVLYLRRRDPRFEPSARRIQDEQADGREWAVLYDVRSDKFAGLIEIYQLYEEPTVTYPAEEHPNIYVVLLTGVGQIENIYICPECGEAFARADDGKPDFSRPIARTVPPSHMPCGSLPDAAMHGEACYCGRGDDV